LHGWFSCLCQTQNRERPSEPQTYLDFAGCIDGGNEGSLERDILRRDFTVNAMVFDPDFNLTSGDRSLLVVCSDLKANIIRAVSESVS
jgi:hypothetical protein